MEPAVLPAPQTAVRPAVARVRLDAPDLRRGIVMVVQLPFEWQWNEQVGFPLAVTYLAWILGAILLDFPCRWFAAVKAAL
jgi:hypothetical protein